MADNQIECDVLVVGGGIGGCCAAIAAKETGKVDEVVLVEKSHTGRTGPSAFVGGIYLGYLSEDIPDETLKGLIEGFTLCGDLCSQKAFLKLIEYGPRTVENLERWGAKFMRGADGKYVRVYQRGSNTMRLDGGGLPLMEALRRYALRIGVQVINWVTVTDLLTRDKRAVGAVGIGSRTAEFFTFSSKATILATGGTVFKSRQPGHRQLSGDGWAMAYRAGADMAGADHDTPNVYGATLEIGPGNGYYLSQGARLLNSKMEEYIKKWPELARVNSPESHSPLMALEARIGNGPPMWLDLRDFTPEQVEGIYRSIPYAAKRWEKLGFIKNKKFVKLCEYAPEGPRAFGAGVLLNRDTFESRNLSCLFACGEAATYYQTSGGLNNAATSGIIAAESAADKADGMDSESVDRNQVEELKEVTLAPLRRKEGIEPEYGLTMIQETLHPYFVNLIRSEKNLKKALGKVDDIKNDVVPYLRAYDPHYLRLVCDVRNMTLCAEIFLRSALERKESRWGALREDYPYTDNVNWLKWVIVSKDAASGEMLVRTEDIPAEEFAAFKLKKERVLHPFWARAEELGYWQRPKNK